MFKTIWTISLLYIRATADDIAAAKTEAEALFGAVELLVQKNAPKMNWHLSQNQ